MKRVTFVSLFILTHLFFIFFQINKHNKFINLSYTKQKYENEIKALTQKKQELSQNLYNLRKSSTIKQFAKETLGMNSISIKQVKKIDLVRASAEQVEKLTMGDGPSKSGGNLSKPEEPTSLATLRYGPKGPTQGERGGKNQVKNPAKILTHTTEKEKITLANNNTQVQS
jgi:hypothetical protein